MDGNDSLSLDPSGQFGEEIAEWQDGKTYDLTVKVQQTAPGRFTVLSVAQPTEATEPAAEEAAPVAKTGNPAVDRMMA